MSISNEQIAKESYLGWHYEDGVRVYEEFACIHGKEVITCIACWVEEQLEAGNLKLTRCPACGNNSYVEIGAMEYCKLCYE